MFRILLSSRCPSIRTADRAVQLKIGRLVIGDHFIKVNETKYEYGIYQVDCKDKIPYRVSGKCDLNGRWTCDVDEFGIRDYITKGGLPGNNGRDERNLFGSNDLENIPTDSGRLQKLRRILITEKQRYVQLLCFKPEYDPVSRKVKRECFETFKSICRNTARVYKDEELELLISEEIVKEAVKNTDERIKQMEFELLPFENRSSDIRPKFEIRLVITQRDSSREERVKYTGDLHKAGENLMEFIFSKRRNFVIVKTLKSEQRCSNRMPCGMKMRIRNLEIMDNAPMNLELMKPIIDESGFPGKLTICYKQNEEKDYEFIGKFKSLVYSDDSSMSLPLVQRFQNKKVHFLMNSFFFLESDKFFVLIRNWCVNIPMKKSKELRISYQPNHSGYLIVMTVVRGGLLFKTRLNFDPRKF
uniref:F-box domain-containing protein n=1 Tax=Caenorhabditis tropicalis TaxID=1561998 RepID=A0A1I7T3S5_9PELO